MYSIRFRFLCAAVALSTAMLACSMPFAVQQAATDRHVHRSRPHADETSVRNTYTRRYGHRDAHAKAVAIADDGNPGGRSGY